LPELQHTVCAKLQTSCLEQVPLTSHNQNNKQGKEQEHFSGGIQCGFQDVEQDATKYSISDKT
jgi:hypothetical protein